MCYSAWTSVIFWVKEVKHKMVTDVSPFVWYTPKKDHSLDRESLGSGGTGTDEPGDDGNTQKLD